MVYTTKIVDALIEEQYKTGDSSRKWKKLWYRGNVGVRNKNLTFIFTDEEIQEYIKCEVDPIYFIENYCKLPGTEGFIKLYKVQKEMVEKMHNNRFSINMTSRQVGGTLMLNLLMLHSFTFKQDRPITLFSNTMNDGRHKIETIKKIYVELPFFMKRGIKKWTKDRIGGDNGSNLRLHSATVGGIGYGLGEVYLDNFAYLKNQEKLFNNIFPEIYARANSKMVINSCINHYDRFYKLFSDAEAGINNFVPNRIYWYDIPNRDDGWKNQMISIMGVDNFDRECNLKISNNE